MLFSEIQTIVQNLIGRGNIDATLLTYFLAKGRREIESRENFYWMYATPKTFSLTINDGEYDITASPISIADFKDIEALLVKDPSDPNNTPWQEVDDYDVMRLEGNYTPNDDGSPEFFVIRNNILTLYPPKPDKAYNMKLYYFKWTDNPAAGSTDELLTRWPDALIFASVAHGVLTLTREDAQAKPWFDLMTSELRKLTAYSKQRGSASRTDLIPRNGPSLKKITLTNRWFW